MQEARVPISVLPIVLCPTAVASYDDIFLDARARVPSSGRPNESARHRRARERPGARAIAQWYGGSPSLCELGSLDAVVGSSVWMA
jgi:hypothetical protein